MSFPGDSPFAVKETVCRENQADMMVPAVPGTSFKVIQSQVALQPLETSQYVGNGRGQVFPCREATCGASFEKVGMVAQEVTRFAGDCQSRAFRA